MQNSLEQIWANTIIDQLICEGHTYFCISPGSRSTPLVLAIAHHPKASSYVYHDERALAYHALGHGMASKKAPVIVVTSGTACGNLLPAIMEASASHIPLIIITADRPYELQDCGANQTTKQTSLFTDFVVKTVLLPAPDTIILEKTLRSLIHESSYLSKKHHLPVHINTPFREPFEIFNDHYPLQKSKLLFSPIYEMSIPSDTLKDITHLLKEKKGLIILGKNAFTSSEYESFQELKNQLSYLIYNDPLSGYPYDNENFLCFVMRMIHQDPPEEFCFDLVLHFGESFVSKSLGQCLLKSPPKFYIQIQPFEKKFDPYHLITHKIEAKPESFCRQILSCLEKNEHQVRNEFLDIKPILNHAIEQYKKSEPYLFWHLNLIKTNHFDLYLGNSMPIRDFQDFFHAQQPFNRIFCNRGLSGIDGNIATCCGIVKQTNEPLLAIIGDQTFFHDLSSLAQIKNLDTPLILIVINNGGGRIFSHLPIGKNIKICQDYFINHPICSPSEIGRCFGIDSYLFDDPDSFFDKAPSVIKLNRSILLEVLTDPAQNALIYQQLNELCLDALYANGRKP